MDLFLNKILNKVRKIKVLIYCLILVFLSFVVCGCQVNNDYTNLKKALDDTINQIEETYDLSAISYNIKLEGYDNNYTYEFISSDESIITNDGVVTRQLEIVNVTIIVRVFKNEFFLQDSFVCTVLPIEKPDEYHDLRVALDDIINYISSTYDLNNITTNIEFIELDNKYTYEYKSSNENVVSNTGIVYRQSVDTEVIITIKIIFNDYSLQDSIEVIVKASIISDGYTYDVENTKSKLKVSELNIVYEDEEYNNYLDVIAYIFYYHKLPKNYLTKSQAKNLGWKGSGNVWVNNNLRGKNIGGDVFNNYEQILPILSNRPYIEVDVNCSGGSRGKYRIVYNKYTFDIYYTDDHYETFTYMIGAIE